jgi:hypothetical protein
VRRQESEEVQVFVGQHLIASAQNTGLDGAHLLAELAHGFTSFGDKGKWAYWSGI